MPYFNSQLSPVTCHLLLINSHWSIGICQMSSLKYHLSNLTFPMLSVKCHVICHMSPILCHLSNVTCHHSNVLYHMFTIIFHLSLCFKVALIHIPLRVYTQQITLNTISENYTYQHLLNTPY